MSDDGVLTIEKLKKVKSKFEQGDYVSGYRYKFVVPCPKCEYPIKAYLSNSVETVTEPCLKCKMGDICG